MEYREVKILTIYRVVISQLVNNCNFVNTFNHNKPCVSFFGYFPMPCIWSSNRTFLGLCCTTVASSYACNNILLIACQLYLFFFLFLFCSVIHDLLLLASLDYMLLAVHGFLLLAVYCRLLLAIYYSLLSATYCFCCWPYIILCCRPHCSLLSAIYCSLLSATYCSLLLATYCFCCWPYIVLCALAKCYWPLWHPGPPVGRASVPGAYPEPPVPPSPAPVQPPLSAPPVPTGSPAAPVTHTGWMKHRQDYWFVIFSTVYGLIVTVIVVVVIIHSCTVYWTYRES